MSRTSFLNSIRFRLPAMLSLALLPIGLIAVTLTLQLEDAAQSNAELSLMALTEQASLSERLIVEEARGAARMLGYTGHLLGPSDQCESVLRGFLETNPSYSFAGLLPVSGLMTCSSAGRPYDFSQTEGFAEDMAEGKSTVMLNRDAPLSGEAVIIVSEPYFDDGVFQGLASVSIPHKTLRDIETLPKSEKFIAVMTFNRDGDILTHSGDKATFRENLPERTDLASLVGEGKYSFGSKDGRGRDRIYTVVPIIDDVVYTLGVWDVNSALTVGPWTFLKLAMFPILMWIAGLIVALFAVHRLVTRHIRKLGRQMRRFADNRTVPSGLDDRGLPSEVHELSSKFHELAQVVVQDEAVLEDNIRDKNVLLKEVHHRVKNNLQLVSSIMNMQIRRAGSSETKLVLSRLQDRILSLATIHRDLYETSGSGRVNAGALVQEIIEKTFKAGTDEGDQINLRTTIEPVHLYPDQAVPLSLLASEAVTNIIKYMAADDQGERWVEATFVAQDQLCTLTLINPSNSDLEVVEAGLGSQLMDAFATQLDGELSSERVGDVFTIKLSFKVAEFVDLKVNY